MKHVKLFENFIEGEKVLIGYYGEGGIGSHPAILSQSGLDKIKSVGNPGQMGISRYLDFIPTSEESTMPEALLCVYNDITLWDIKGISSSQAETIMSMGGDYYVIDSETDPALVSELIDVSGYTINPNASLTILTVIPNVTIDTIYWSNVPEETHSYWAPPYRAFSVDEIIEGIHQNYAAISWRQKTKNR
jgi:hypothetical protein